ncbi:hypothetical protein EVAR_44600_1 [Eumeta japonica]|uniref:RNase H type-1 domain-containing protein n=1 Tax=Eumeta variegata TaxID=151549 RepID=A0A4C1XDG7_EUMVA|nr:hypothetical protein EVAR_44600_1 [Eumeta japonica]
MGRVKLERAGPHFPIKRGELERPVDLCDLPHPAHTPEFGFESVEDLDPSTMDRLAIRGETFEISLRKAGEVRLFWVRGHAGAASNKRADELTRNVALKRKTAADYDRFSLTYAKKAIRAASLDKW